MEDRDYVFHRDFFKEYPLIAYGKGVYLFDEDGRRYLDACSGAVAANLGHGRTEIAAAMQEQASKAAFVHTLRFETSVLHELAEKTARLAPKPLNTVYFTSGGSEANESAIKLSRQLHHDSGKPQKNIVIGRWQSYHGNTYGSLSAGGDIKRRQLYQPNLVHFSHIHPPHCLRCPYQRKLTSCNEEKNWSCAASLESMILELGPQNVSAFIAEPITGSQLGASVPPGQYLKEIRKICDRYDVIMIADEVMTGFGRTGCNFAIEHWDVVPDIITFGKGISAGYAPLAGMIVHDNLAGLLKEHSNGVFQHGYTYSGHPVSAAAGLAALAVYEKEAILENVKRMGAHLVLKLEELKEKIPYIYHIRGRGLLIGVEFARGRSGIPFPPHIKLAEKINERAMELGAVFYPGSGSVNGVRGDHILICPPLSVKAEEIDEALGILEKAVLDVVMEEGNQNG
ncbi:aspartate aminotransferase family protein [Peribacillus sp. SCS-37]|uniref:aminotransferase family protein n=1 Tax=Paraperibacillus esterisolvens TaxID=3115296 RepID=UPI003905AE61